ncbi:SCO4848 family membrane protein [Streptomyces sp. 8N616]|uniref:SCO4848 family membrane protein n=1 Tax=Streptomyces sp. 8N616 TaxID=3457414 RepID=UPI003FD1E9CA
MKLSRPVSWFLLAFGVWSWFIWITFVKNLWNDASGLAFDDAGEPTAYFWVHLALAATSFLLGTAIGLIGLRGVRALRREVGAAGTAGSPGSTAGKAGSGGSTSGTPGSAGSAG